VVDTSTEGEILGECLPLEQKQEEVDDRSVEEKEEIQVEEIVLPKTISKQSILKMTESSGSKVDSVEEEQESGLEITAGREHKSYEDSSLMDHSSEFFGSDKTDSLLQESTLHESYLMEKTLSEQTLKRNFPLIPRNVFLRKGKLFLQKLSQ
jgi:hypothetical protein